MHDLDLAIYPTRDHFLTILKIKVLEGMISKSLEYSLTL